MPNSSKTLTLANRRVARAATFAPLIAAFASIAAFAFAAGCTKGTTGSGGASNQGGASSTGSIEIDNLNVTIDEAMQQVRLTFLVDNNSGKTIEECNTGSITTSTGETAVVDKSFSGSCNGFVPPEGQTVADFCGAGDWDTLCSSGLAADTTTGVITLYGASDSTMPEPWAASGTEYTLHLQFIMTDASLLDVTAKATVQ